MLNPSLIETFERRLATLQLPAKRRQRAVEELSEHREDLIQAGVGEGLSRPEAVLRAERSLGDPTELADQIVFVARCSSLWGRHPIFSFCVLPFLGMNVAIILSFAAVIGFFYYMVPSPHWRSWDDATLTAMLTAHYASIELWTHVIQLVTTAATALIFCRLAVRSTSSIRWMWIASAICSALSYVMQIFFSPHAVSIGYLYGPKNAFATSCGIIPLAIASLVQLRRRAIRFDRLASTAVAVVLLPLLSFGCTTEKPDKPPHTRAWVGGEYQLVKKAAKMPAFPAPHVFYRTNFPKSLSQSRAIYVNALATNSPAYIAGLRTNDFIVEWNCTKVTSLHQFRSLLNKAPAGSAIHMKVLRNDQPFDLTIHAGTEKYYNRGMFLIAFPSIVEGWDLWPDPGFSLVFLGYEPKQKIRRDLKSEKELTFEKWRTWCAIFEASASDQIVAQTRAH